MLTTASSMAKMILNKITPKNNPPPSLLIVNEPIFKASKSFLSLGNRPTNSIPVIAMEEVSNVKFLIPFVSPLTNASSETSHIPRSIVLIEALDIAAALATVVNNAYDAPSLPSGHNCAIIMAIGRNCKPAIKSAHASSPKAKKNGLSPKVLPSIRKSCSTLKKPATNVVIIYTIRQLHSKKNFLYTRTPTKISTSETISNALRSSLVKFWTVFKYCLHAGFMTCSRLYK
mmetsp:Transcript_19406/g.22323  ORF Transcript_19406/g.22323 Transcript_19406/m.22323 type:complete len:230 (-) Transcript_19406:1015-1704(-)